MWVTKLLISPVKKRIFCPKTTKFGPKLAFLVNLGQAMQAYSMPCCGSVGGCGARAVSRKTPIYFMVLTPCAGFFRQILPWSVLCFPRMKTLPPNVGSPPQLAWWVGTRASRCEDSSPPDLTMASSSFYRVYGAWKLLEIKMSYSGFTYELLFRVLRLIFNLFHHDKLKNFN